MSKPTNDYIKYTGIAFQMIFIIGVLTFVGYKIDAYTHHDTPWVTAVLALVGVFASLYLVIQSVKE
ncbi:AtpZ/AtpI family protein [Mucilaginibacter robiniae]|uniref:AtpZ/AtpI family protein n=1 Tax=Mucilaginibacter robiniae TaxID=2728022 RepID=A0A7L5E5K5_9SPHI|nr:AtpZ/AtpI family protein [Mucilaginibacter robiniae]QJD95626.1 AtpZ/AtpI family protein [Mucilaginibacter robiniae]